MHCEADHGRVELVGDAGDRPRSWILFVDGTAQSHVDLDDPTHLEFEYVRRLGHITDALEPPPPTPLRVLHLGGGAWTLPRYVAATRPGSTQTVLEIDGALAEFVATHLPPEGFDLDVRICDAREGLDEITPGVDLVVLDVFAGARIPAHLTTVEFLQAVAAVLAPHGIFTANLADSAPFDFVRAQVATAAAVLGEVMLIIPPEVLHGHRFGNVVLVAGARLPRAGIARRIAADPFPARLIDDTVAWAETAEPVTDATAVPSPLPPPGFFGRPE